MAALEEISKMCGEVKSKEKDKTASTPLVTITDLQKMKLFQAIIIRSRMAPFKTQLEPDFKMDWGIKREEMDFPHREIKHIDTFDIKNFVSEAKRKQMMENNASNSEPFNPFMGNMPSMPFNPFGGMPVNNSMPMNRPGSNLTSEEIDKMIADIDKKLAELDEEEAKEKEKLASKDEEKQPIVKKEKIVESKEKEEEKPTINVDTDSIIMNDDAITDDEFFDDFFNE